MKIAFFSEMGFEGKTDRAHENMRIEFAWFVALKSTHYNIQKLATLENNSYDIGIIIIPKNIGSYKNINIPYHLKRICKKWAFMQEGPSWYYQSLSIVDSFWFYNIMINSDFVLCHNNIDMKYYMGLLNKSVYINPALIIEDLTNSIDKKIKRKNVIIGGNFGEWYRGFDSYLIANIFKEKIYSPQMGRMHKDELQFEELNHLPYMEWFSWIKKLNEFKYAVHLISNTIGGSFQLNCAYLGIPCISNNKIYTQKLCQPRLSIDIGDMQRAKELAIKLKIDKNFYNQCSIEAKENYKKYFHESVYKKKMNEIFKGILSEKN